MQMCFLWHIIQIHHQNPVSDLIHGVKWVKNEIEEFGGDPNRLTVMGDSGGGSNTKMVILTFPPSST